MRPLSAWGKNYAVVPLTGNANTNNYLCHDTAYYSLRIAPSSSITCGAPFTDPRDGISYETVLIGTQCWMSSNLAYGMTIDEFMAQTDNCVAEKYASGGTIVQCLDLKTEISNLRFEMRNKAFYPWDELMQYQTMEGVELLVESIMDCFSHYFCFNLI